MKKCGQTKDDAGLDRTMVNSSDDPIENANNSILKEQINKVLETLPPREKQVLEMRYGLNGDNPLTLEEIGMLFGVKRERIRQIEAKAIRRLKHPVRSKQLKECLEY